MTITLFGALAILIGFALLLWGSMTQMLVFAMSMTLMGGSAALQLTSLGGSSIPPANLSLVFLMLRAVLPGPGQMAALVTTIRQNGFLIVFALYGSFSAWVLPRLFARQGRFTPLRPGAVRELFETASIHFSSQNITTSVYMLGTLAAGLGSFIGASKPGAARIVVKAAVAIAITHATLGVLSVVGAGTPIETFIGFFRNGHYAQLDQSVSGVSGMNGIWPEASAFAAYGAGWFIFTTELWLRDVSPKATGFAAAYLGAALAVSTSSTAYVALSGYIAIFILRSLIVPQGVRPQKIAILLGSAFALVVLVLLTMTLVPSVLERMTHILAVVTVNKTQSYSGMQRAFWAKQGLDAFILSGGLGIGAGSFRSSSLITAILGSMGVVGIVTFAAHLLRAFKPLRASTYYGESDSARAVGAAASWASLLLLMPAAVSAPSPDPGVVWAIFTGIAIALRPDMVAQTAQEQPRRQPSAVPALALHRSPTP